MISLGCVLGVFFCQFTYFEIDPKISLSDLFIFLLTSLLGIYIAYTINKKLSRTQLVKGLFQEDIKNIIENLVKINMWVELGAVPFHDLTKHMKAGNLKLQSIAKIYAATDFQVDTLKISAILSNYNNIKYKITDLEVTNENLIVPPGQKNQFSQEIDNVRCDLLTVLINLD